MRVVLSVCFSTAYNISVNIFDTLCLIN